VLLAELEVRHSRAIAPTRRVALGELWLPTDPPPGAGGMLLAGVVAGLGGSLDDETRDGLERLIADLELGRRILQPRLRHRFQTDVVGLDRSRHKLVAFGESTRFDLDDHGAPVPQVLGAVYAVRTLAVEARPVVFDTIRRALRWDGPVGPELIEFLRERRHLPWRGVPTDARWALRVLGFGPEADAPGGEAVRRRFRSLVREVHPDHGAASEGAGQRILELTEARRILLA